MLLDKDIREPLFDFLEERYGKVRILEEKTVGNSRADVVMVIPDKIVGIEIKSDADTYTRLESQVADYDLYFDQNIVVVGSTHAGHVAEHVPDYWGIISVEEYDTGIKSDTDGKADANNLPWGKIGVDVVLECTGFYCSKEKSMAHINAGAKKVVCICLLVDCKSLTINCDCVSLIIS